MADKKKEKDILEGRIPSTPPAKNARRVVRTVAVTEGFRRAGLKHSKTAKDFPIDDLDEDQLRALFGEKLLKVEVVDVPVKPADKETKSEEA